MNVYDSEQEQVESLKRWWKENGTVTVIGLTLGLGGVGGWNWWQAYTKAQSEGASAIYEQLADAAAGQAPDLVDQYGNRLLQEYPDSGYGPLASLIMAKSAFQQGNLAESRRRLQWVLESAERPELRLTARLRLAGLALDAKDYDGALTLLDSAEPGAFKAAFEERRGDTLIAKGDEQGARAAYERALAEMLPDAPNRVRVQLKLDDLGHVGYSLEMAETPK